VRPNYRQIASQIADLSQSLLAALGARWSWFRWRYEWASEATLRRVLQSIDAAELDLLIGSWLGEQAYRDTDGLLVIALDGKVLRGACSDDNSPAHPVLGNGPRRGRHHRAGPGA
jgi:hypothetical protein